MKALDIMNTPIIAASRKASTREVALYMLLGGFSGVADRRARWIARRNRHGVGLAAPPPFGEIVGSDDCR